MTAAVRRSRRLAICRATLDPSVLDALESIRQQNYERQGELLVSRGLILHHGPYGRR